MTTIAERRCPLCGALGDDLECPDCGHGTVPYEVTLRES